MASQLCWAADGHRPPDLRGRFAVVTGANRGIGKGVALGLGEAQATVFVTGRKRTGTMSGPAGHDKICLMKL